MSGSARFADRKDGGRALAKALERYRGEDCVVLGLPRGGVVTASEVAKFLGAPLVPAAAAKVRHPSNREYGIGAVSAEGDVVLDAHECGTLPAGSLDVEIEEAVREARSKAAKFATRRSPISVQGRTAILVDDGIATGYSLKAAAKAVRRRAPAWLVVAAPVGPAGAAAMFAGIADEIVIVVSPPVLTSIGALYDDFAQVTDSEVVDALESVESPRDGRNRGRGW